MDWLYCCHKCSQDVHCEQSRNFSPCPIFWWTVLVIILLHLSDRLSVRTNCSLPNSLNSAPSLPKILITLFMSPWGWCTGTPWLRLWLLFYIADSIHDISLPHSANQSYVCDCCYALQTVSMIFLYLIQPISLMSVIVVMHCRQYPWYFSTSFSQSVLCLWLLFCIADSIHDISLPHSTNQSYVCDCCFALQTVSMIFLYLIQPISLMFCGHLGKKELASAAMAISVSVCDAVLFQQLIWDCCYIVQCQCCSAVKCWDVARVCRMFFSTYSCMPSLHCAVFWCFRYYT